MMIVQPGTAPAVGDQVDLNGQPFGTVEEVDDQQVIVATGSGRVVVAREHKAWPPTLETK